MPRRFEFVGGGSSKFWVIEMSGKSSTVRFGRIGTDGQSKSREFESPEDAKREVDKQVREKTGKGYLEKP